MPSTWNLSMRHKKEDVVCFVARLIIVHEVCFLELGSGEGHGVGANFSPLDKDILNSTHGYERVSIINMP